MADLSYDLDARMRSTAFEHLRQLSQIFDQLSSTQLGAGFQFNGERIPLINPQRGIFKPRQMSFLLPIRTVFPKPGRRIWYDDQTEVHRQIFEGEETIDYAFMGQNPDAPDNRWLREAMENRIPIVYFLGTSPGEYQAVIPTYIVDWNPFALRARIAFENESRFADSLQETASKRQPPALPMRRNAATRYARLSNASTKLHFALQLLQHMTGDALFPRFRNNGLLMRHILWKIETS
jgi:putative restriction endonuclease